ncbi:Aste57867_23730 [Aphanomyces stellatus]|uniref:Aste57867_23730 protein n=1 Tax=Aphanomyces stellatus TaxID=120398 RepID=A0A485LNF0_9STRA|nr:hypothetical protein As57867_023658 [Aphanomyces stellatus]VFU00375.1 Aste57867_23730 [Aphanomyces stellatus]
MPLATTQPVDAVLEALACSLVDETSLSRTSDRRLHPHETTAPATRKRKLASTRPVEAIASSSVDMTCVSGRGKKPRHGVHQHGASIRSSTAPPPSRHALRIHAIADRHFRQLDAARYPAILRAPMAAPFRLVCAVAWARFNAATDVPPMWIGTTPSWKTMPSSSTAAAAVTSMEHITVDLSYTQVGDPSKRTVVVRKRYMEDAREVFLVVRVDEGGDEMRVSASEEAARVSWVEVAPLPEDPTQSVLTYYVAVDRDVLAMEAMMQRVSVAEAFGGGRRSGGADSLVHVSTNVDPGMKSKNKCLDQELITTFLGANAVLTTAMNRVDDETTWNVEDLQFLLANDDDLQDEFAQVCDLLLDGPSPPPEMSIRSSTEELSPDETSPTTPPPTVPRTNRRKAKRAPEVRFEVRQKQEMLHLREQVEQLKKRLQASQAKQPPPSTSSSIVPTTSTWEHIAKRERTEAQKVLTENELLKDAVHEQVTFIEHMEKLCRKKPRLTKDDVEAWEGYRLAAHESLRIAAIHAIADRQLRRFGPTMAAAGITNSMADYLSVQIVPMPSGASRLEYVNHIVLAAPYETIGQAVWRVFGCETPPLLPPGMTDTVEFIDKCTIYYQSTDTARRCYANTIRKYYPEVDRHTIVARTVLEDALMPHMVRGAMEDKSGWIQVVPFPSDSTKSIMTVIIHIEVGLLPPDSGPVMDAITSMMEQFSLAQKPEVPGTFSPASACAHINEAAIPYLHIQSVAAREKLVVAKFSESVNEAIQTYLRETLQSLPNSTVF